MKKINLWIILLAVFILGSQHVAFAQLISGKVDAVDVGGGNITLTQNNASTGSDEQVQVFVTPQTTYEGIQSLTEIHNDEEIWVEVEENNDIWKATKITKA